MFRRCPYFISIHSLRMEGDYMRLGDSFIDSAFQSTPSAWRETISATPHVRRPRHFNPLPPHGGRRITSSYASGIRWAFQSTPSAWRETRLSRNFFRFFPFQSTPSAWRETHCVLFWNADRKFQSTPSAWRETLSQLLSGFRIPHFNPLPPHGGRHGF